MKIRSPKKSDAEALTSWFSDPDNEPLLPMSEPSEISDCGTHWVDMAMRDQCGLVAELQGKPVGFGLLFLQTYKRIIHQCLHVLLVDRPFRKMGVGSQLLDALTELAKSRGVELLHVEVYGSEEVERFYRKRGYAIYGRQEKWAKNRDGSVSDRIFLERFI